MRHLLGLVLSFALSHPAAAGLTATFRSGDATDTRTDRIPALLVAPGQAPTPFLAPGPFEVTWTGTLVTTARQRLFFSFEGEGHVSLTLNGEEVLSEQGTLGAAKSDRIRLNPGEHPFSLTYRSNDDGSGRLRVFWEERSFPRQSLPPSAFKPLDPAPSAARAGRELLAASHCAKCHLPGQGLGSDPMPEMLEIAPLLANTGGRLNEAWLAEWIAAPHDLKPGTNMPALVDPTTEEGRQHAADLAAWLVTMKIAEPPAAPDPSLARVGGEHFHRLGCVACHSRPDAASRDPRRLPLDRVADKFLPGALVDYLKQPEQWHPHTGMPNFRLGDDEASSLAAWLLQASASIDRDRPSFPAGNASRGTDLAHQLNCGACHSGLPMDVARIPSLEAIFEKDLSHGCAAATHPSPLPVYRFEDDQRAALAALDAAGPDSLARHVPAEYARRKLVSERCDACHSLDRAPSLLAGTHPETAELVAHVATEDDKVDQSLPHLTFIGEMLHASYLQSMIAGTVSPRPRPWLDMRMPGYPAQAALISQGLAHLHGVVPGEPEPFRAEPDFAKVGELLVGKNGFGCNTCHAVADEPPTAAFEVQGVNLALAPARLRRDWYFRWMDNPLSVTPGSKMPRYAEDGETQRTDVLDGDAHRQFDAIWHYLHTLPKN